MKVTRSEFDANETQASAVVQSMAAELAIQSLRRDWRAVLSKREAHRDNRRAMESLRRTMRRSHVRNIGRASIGMLSTMATAAGAILAAAARIFGGA